MTRQTVSSSQQAPKDKTVVAGPRGGLSYDPAISNSNKKPVGKPQCKPTGRVIGHLNGGDIKIDIVQDGSKFLARDYTKSAKSREIVGALKSMCSEPDDVFDNIPKISDRFNLGHTG